MNIWVCPVAAESLSRAFRRAFLSSAFTGRYPQNANDCPSIPEADILAKLDEMDAVMELFRTNLEKLEPGEISNPIPLMDNRRIYKTP